MHRYEAAQAPVYRVQPEVHAVPAGQAAGSGLLGYRPGAGDAAVATSLTGAAVRL